ncbi:hypothetical protein [Arenimonas caeni]|jgi:hypothetical protein|uniref:Uncharacterized protein n=1 Tax=Arenimonas caeni TaxID=2058085 RepID=A0A2P6MAB3_9GAMM|nr:hypothetical protein [Arenimonas caeni]MDY0021908.1 hypothetical protein [Arenimonas caeni]PRH82892.1 hypothetical protein C6N40_04395 [Arenimonas caeni]
MTPRLLLLPLVCLLAACGEGAPAPEAAPAGEVVASAPAGVDWSRCHVPGLSLPVAARLFVVDGGEPVPDAEPGRESIRRVDVLVPGPVALLMTAPDATAWHVRPGPETELRAVVALGDAPQRITGQRLGQHRLERSAAFGDACASYLLADGPGPALGEATDQVFGKPHDALYRLRVGSVVIGGTGPLSDRPVGQ